MACSSFVVLQARNTFPHQHHEKLRLHGQHWDDQDMNISRSQIYTYVHQTTLLPTLPSTSMQQTSQQIVAQQAGASETAKPPPLPSNCADKAFYRFHSHTLSDSTNSNDSSPTTTVSTVEDSSATEPSPGSSPESPPPSNFSAGMLRPRTADYQTSPFFELQKQPPPRKGRNLKNLAVDTTRHNARAASTTSLPLKAAKAETLPNILSPAFVKPPSPPRRRANNLSLTLLTPANNKAIREVKPVIPPAPALRTGTLRHFQSSPLLPLVPGLSIQTEIRAPSTRTSKLETIFTPLEQTQTLPAAVEDEPNYDIPLSQEVKPEAYPDGPICVYPPYVDLYLEPNAEQCRQYDCIFNVASEVRNPLVEHIEPPADVPDLRIDGGGGIQFAPKRPQLQSTALRPTAEHSPTTPKATPLNSNFPVDAETPTRKEPEYIHIEWEHNSDIVPDLLRLCKLVDEKVQHGKRVLIHCQCGVSRSASLVVAYGLYKNPSMSVQEAYDAVKARSKWIGPNMNLIMQLQEFRTSLSCGGVLSSNRALTPLTPGSGTSDWRGPFSSSPSDPSAFTMPLSASVAETPQQARPSPSLPPVEPGPSSAPSGLKWPRSQDAPPVPQRRARTVSAVKRTSAYVDASGHLVPVVKVVEPRDSAVSFSRPTVPALIPHEEPDQITPTKPLASPRAEGLAMTPLLPLPKEADPADSFGLMSPTSTSFASSPFDRSALLASLGMSGSTQHYPRRTSSLRKPPQAPLARPLKPKLSSPSLGEQKQLHKLQADIAAKLHLQGKPSPETMDAPPADFEDALMSPRATEFTRNPFALSWDVPEAKDEGSRTSPSPSPLRDPRSPAQVGGSPITRNILDVL